VFSQELKPMEVEILVVQVGDNGRHNELYRISFDGSIFDERGYAVIGGKSEAVQIFLKERYKNLLPLKEALALCISALENVTNQKLLLEGLEIAVLARDRVGRKFRRVPAAEASRILA
jgi:proteasome alpha subunit